jgi:hypothetical protein
MHDTYFRGLVPVLINVNCAKDFTQNFVSMFMIAFHTRFQVRASNNEERYGNATSQSCCIINIILNKLYSLKISSCSRFQAPVLKKRRFHPIKSYYIN